MRLLVVLLSLLMLGAMPVQAADDWVPEGGLRIKRSQSNIYSNSEFDQPARTPGPALSPYAQGLPGIESARAQSNYYGSGYGTVPQTNSFQAFNQPPAMGIPGASPDNGAAFRLDVSRYASPGNSLAENSPVLPIGPASAIGNAATTFIKRLMGQDLQVLSTREVIVLIDKSGSMGDKDCPPSSEGLRFPFRTGEPTQWVSRWEWCEQELISFSHNAAGALSNGVRLVLFDGSQDVFDHTNVSQISNIFQHNWPEGSTNTAAALRSQLDRYFQERAANGGNAKPVVIAVITDGLPNNTSAVKKVIIEASHAVRSPAEVAITFLQIGNDKKGVKFVHELDDQLVSQGASFDIVDTKDFGELQRIGLGHALVDAINEAGQSR